MKNFNKSYGNFLIAAFIFVIIAIIFSSCSKKDELCPDLRCSIFNKDTPTVVFNANLNYCDDFNESIEAITRIDNVEGTGIWMDGQLEGFNDKYECICRY